MEKSIVVALNKQVAVGLDSSYLYVQMAEWFDSHKLAGFADWLRKRAHEEVGYALILFNCLVDNGADVSLGKVDPKHHTFFSARDALGTLLMRGKFIASGVNALLDLAGEAEDDDTRLILTWLSAVRMEEEAAVLDIIERVNKAGGGANDFGNFADGGSDPDLRELDAELAGREFSRPELRKRRQSNRFMAG